MGCVKKIYKSWSRTESCKSSSNSKNSIPNNHRNFQFCLFRNSKTFSSDRNFLDFYNVMKTPPITNPRLGSHPSRRVKNPRTFHCLHIPEITNPNPKMHPNKNQNASNFIFCLSMIKSKTTPANKTHQITKLPIFHPSSPQQSPFYKILACHLIVAVANPKAINTQTATVLLFENLGKPQTPCPLVQPFPTFVPKPTKIPPIINPTICSFSPTWLALSKKIIVQSSQKQTSLPSQRYIIQGIEINPTRNTYLHPISFADEGYIIPTSIPLKPVIFPQSHKFKVVDKPIIRPPIKAATYSPPQQTPILLNFSYQVIVLYMQY